MEAETTSSDLWTRLRAHLPEFSSAVLTGLDAHGYPYSVRCQPRVDANRATLWMPVAPSTPLQPGPASLLCHRHDELLWNQRSFLVRGTIERDGGEWRFHPRQYVAGMGYGGVLGMARFVVGARRAAAAYLARRGLARPSIPWDEIIAAKRQARLPQPEPRPLSPLLVAAAALGIIGVCSLLLALLLGRRSQAR